MLNPRLASRYAKSLIGLAIEKGSLENVFADMQWLKSVCESNRDFVNLLKSPVINKDVKKKILGSVSAGKLSEMTVGFNNLLINKNRENILPEIVNAFITAYKELKNIQTIHLTTASAISDKIRQAIIEQVKKSGGFQNVEMEEKINPDIIGGFVLQVGDKLVDASIAYDLREIAKQFENNDFIYKIS